MCFFVLGFVSFGSMGFCNCANWLPTNDLRFDSWLAEVWQGRLLEA